MKKLLFNLIWIPISAFFLLLNIRIVAGSLENLINYYSHSDLEIGRDWKITLLLQIIGAFFFLWVITHIAFELTAFFKPSQKMKYYLKHLRFAPATAFIFSIIITLAFDFGMIQYSKYELKSYIYNNSQTIEKPDLILHNDHRGFCGNGYTARQRFLYFDTASVGFSSENPYVRSRSLLATYEVYDWLNGGRADFDQYLSKSCNDESPIVRQTAETILTDRNSSCSQSFSLK